MPAQPSLGAAMRRRDKWLIGILIVVAILIAIRAALPVVVRDYVNDKLQALEGYDGHVGDVDLALWRGAYGVDEIEIVKTGAKQPVPFFSARRVDFSVEWPSLLQGSLVAEGVFWTPNVNFVQSDNAQQSQTGEGENWGDRLAELFPFQFNTITVHDGIITFRAPGISTADAMKATNVEAEVTNITNVVAKDKETFAEFNTTASVLEGGSARISGSVDPLESKPTFDVNLQLSNVQLPQVNPWLRQYIKADAEAGDFELYLELAAADGKFQGYAKPVLRNVNIYSSAEEEESLLKRVWEGLVDFAANVLENEDKEQVAARIPFTGTIDNPETSVLATIVSVLKNAFVGAFARSLEGSISVRSVRENLQGVGEPAANKKDDDKKKDEDKKDDKEKSKDAQPKDAAKSKDSKRSDGESTSTEPSFGPRR